MLLTLDDALQPVGSSLSFSFLRLDYQAYQIGGFLFHFRRGELEYGVFSYNLNSNILGQVRPFSPSR
jgi:hypothetical protein